MLHVALYSGIYVKADAISTSLHYKRQILRALSDAGAPLRVTVFTQGSDYAGEPGVCCVGTVPDLMLQPDFHAAGIHLFEFGIRYDLFNAVFLVPPEKPVLAVYHNVTPPELADSAEGRDALLHSLVQKHNLARADRVACDSPFNRDDLIATGIPADRLSVLSLPPAIDPLPRERRVEADTVELLFVGRMVPAKGISDLLRAVGLLRARGVHGVRLTLAGNTTFSSASCLQELREVVSSDATEVVVQVVPSPDSAMLSRLYAQCDALVMPSYHEGYCMPVVEAYAAGCYVIAYDSTNLPNVVGGLGTLVPTGDVEALADALAGYVDAVHAARRRGAELPALPLGPAAMPAGEWQRAVAAHVARHSYAVYERDFLDLLAWAARRASGGMALLPWLEGGAPVLAGSRR